MHTIVWRAYLESWTSSKGRQWNIIIKKSHFSQKSSEEWRNWLILTKFPITQTELVFSWVKLAASQSFSHHCLTTSALWIDYSVPPRLGLVLVTFVRFKKSFLLQTSELLAHENGEEGSTLFLKFRVFYGIGTFSLSTFVLSIPSLILLIPYPFSEILFDIEFTNNERGPLKNDKLSWIQNFTH